MSPLPPPQMARRDGQWSSADPRTMTLPVLMLTSSSEEEERFQSQRLGASHFVRKPVDFQRFAEAVAQLGLHWLLSTHLPTPVVAASP